MAKKSLGTWHCTDFMRLWGDGKPKGGRDVQVGGRNSRGRVEGEPLQEAGEEEE